MVELKVIGENSIVTTYLAGVTVLEKMAMTTISPVEGYCIARQKLPHHPGYGNFSCSQ